MNVETNRVNIKDHLLQRTRQLNADISLQNNIIESAENTAKNAKIKLLNLTAERLAILERAIDFGYNPEGDEY